MNDFILNLQPGDIIVDLESGCRDLILGNTSKYKDILLPFKDDYETKFITEIWVPGYTFTDKFEPVNRFEYVEFNPEKFQIIRDGKILNFEVKNG